METNSDALLWEQIRKSKAVRLKLARESQYWFFHIYFGNHTGYETAPFQKEIYQLTSDPDIKHVIICAFRGSGKSTIATLCCPIWSVLGAPQKKFVLVLSQTQPLAKSHLQNIKRAFESNELLRNDFGSVEEEADEWGSMSLVLPKYGARITAASVDQSIRGARHGAYRPDLIIADDVEDMASAKTSDGRERTYQWFVSEVIPASDQNTKIINIGNLLHEDSLLMRFKERIDKSEMDGVYREYPIVGNDGWTLWPGKYPDATSLELQERKVIDHRAWLREYMLKIVPEDAQIILPEWIKLYDHLPPKDEEHEYLGTVIGVDLAISEKTSADCTAVVIVHAYGAERLDRRYYVDRSYINHRLTFMKAKSVIQQLYFAQNNDDQVELVVEDNGYQKAMIEALQESIYNIQGVSAKGDKHSRLMAASMLFEQGRVLLPRDERCKPIINQLVGFGVEKHDDLTDAVTIALNHVQTIKFTIGEWFAID